MHKLQNNSCWHFHLSSTFMGQSSSFHLCTVSRYNTLLHSQRTHCRIAGNGSESAVIFDLSAVTGFCGVVPVPVHGECCPEQKQLAEFIVEC